mmetsp:Transcript_23098/g.35161  ORF Transcript_23098/g.35161 Transcript_23098/m.35161 type:complete len:223 (+) Transcript_23098:1-669(+)
MLAREVVHDLLPSWFLLLLFNLDRLHLDRIYWLLGTYFYFFNLFDDVHAFDNLSKHRMRTFRFSIIPIEMLIVLEVDKKLRASRVRFTRIGHGQRPLGVRYTLYEFVLDIAVFIPRVFLAGTGFERRVGRTGSLTGIFVQCSVIHVRILCVGTTKLNAIVGSDPMNVQAVVEFLFDQVDEIPTGDWHLFRKELCLEGSFGRFEGYSCHSHTVVLLLFRSVSE